jgi:hypothetical protein
LSINPEETNSLVLAGRRCLGEISWPLRPVSGFGSGKVRRGGMRSAGAVGQRGLPETTGLPGEPGGSMSTYLQGAPGKPHRDDGEPESLTLQACRRGSGGPARISFTSVLVLVF